MTGLGRPRETLAGKRPECRKTISPGVTRTPELFEQVIPVFLSRAPIDRIAGVADLQGAVVYQAAEVSDFMVGQELGLDGGYTLM